MQHHTNLNLGYADPQAYHLWRGGFDRYMLGVAARPARPRCYLAVTSSYRLGVLGCMRAH